MAQVLIALAALAGPGFSSQHLQGDSQPSANCPNSLFCLPWAPGMHVVHRQTYMQTSTHTHKSQK
ncbi:hypothetical protein I79_022989 [Cricetulus griseus]|uniref:Uncharacterized protein n=1 Tax=Cricetulus griseus TaxID=10029 RepID=G3IGR4_CRIGR|nr:hypothetical protein I79_022989 [Cricetulus griseus]